MDDVLPQLFGLILVLGFIFGMIYLILSFARPEQASKLADVVKAIIFALLRRKSDSSSRLQRPPKSDDPQ